MANVEKQSTLAMKRDAAKKQERPRYGAKRDAILKAAGSVLDRKGFAGTTIEAIAQQAGLDRATVYYYFSDKGAIFRAAIHDGLTDMVKSLEEVAGSDEQPEARLRSSMRAVMRSFERHYPMLYIYLRSGDSATIIDDDLNQELIDSGRRYEDLVERVVRYGVGEGVFNTSLPPKVFAKSVTGMLNWTSHWFVPGGMLTADDVADGMADMILSGVLPR